MNRLALTLPSIALLLLSACGVSPAPTALEPHTMQVEPGQRVLVQLNEGEVLLTGGDAGELRVQGVTIAPDQTKYSVEQYGDEIRIIANYSGGGVHAAPVRLEVSLPHGLTVRVETEAATITVQDFNGDLVAASTSGDILLERIQGSLTARSSRGDIKIMDSRGTVSVAGNYGSLALERVEGDIGLATIMGEVQFTGPIREGGAVRLETDHAPITVTLSADSALSFEAASTSGELACVLPGAAFSSRSCRGEVNSGGGTLTVRTVSGAISLRLLP